MHSRETVELFLYALEKGMGVPLAGVASRTAEGKSAPIPARGTYGPPAGLAPDQIENLLLRAVLADLKAAGWDPASISNRSKGELGET